MFFILHLKCLNALLVTASWIEFLLLKHEISPSSYFLRYSDCCCIFSISYNVQSSNGIFPLETERHASYTELSIVSLDVSVPKRQKPTEANISSMSSWLAVWDVVSHLLLFIWSSSDSPDTDSSVFFLCPFSCSFFTSVLRVEDFNRLLSVWTRVLRRACPLSAAEDRQALGTDPWGVEAQQASRLKVRNLLWML